MKRIIHPFRLICFFIILTLLPALVPTPVISASAVSPGSSASVIEPVAGSPGPFVPRYEETERYEVTLITGDIVVVSVTADGHKNIGILPAENNTAGNFRMVDRPSGSSGTNTYVIPNDIDSCFWGN